MTTKNKASEQTRKRELESAYTVRAWGETIVEVCLALFPILVILAAASLYWGK